MIDFSDKKILCVMAHPDDEVLGCGGALAKARDEGAEITVLLSLQRRDLLDRCSWSTACKQFNSAVKYLGAKSVILNNLLREDCSGINESIVESSISPYIELADIVFTHHSGDVHHSHRLISKAVEIATRPFERKKWVLQCFIPTSTDQGYRTQFSPNLFVTLSEPQAIRKATAMGLYKNEDKPGRDYRSIINYLRVVGNKIGSEYAEEFFIARAFL